MSSVAAALVASAFCAGLRPEPEITVSEWADAYRVVGKPSPWPGEWRTERVPYTREIMDRLTPSDPCEIVAIKKAAQGAGTEILLNALGCWMHQHPDSTMMVLPTIGSAKKFVRTRFDRMVDVTPVLRAIVAEPRSRDASNTTQLKEFGEGRDSLVFAGANSGPDLRSYPSRFIIADEIDGYPEDLDKEGNPLDLLIQRTGTFANRKIGLCSTPTLKGRSNIDRWYLAGDQNQFCVPCPLCGHKQPLILGADRVKTGQPGGLRWDKGQPSTVLYECERCVGRFAEWQKTEALLHGEWQPSAPGNGGGKIRSYHMNALIYPYGWPESSWANLAAQYELVHDKPIAKKTFVNLKLGEAWEDPAEAQADAATLLTRCEAYGPTIPAQVGVLTAGVDIQGNRIEAELVGWGPDEESWSIEYKVFLGDTSGVDKPVWKELDAWLSGTWLSELNIDLALKGACIDASYHQETVREFCAQRSSRNIWAVRGKDGYGRAVWPVKLGKQKGKLPPPFLIGVDTIKEVVYSRLRQDPPGPGSCHFPKGDRDLYYFEMLLAERRVADYSKPIPTYSWKKISESARNEALDCRNYAYACTQGLKLMKAFHLNRECVKLRELAEAKRTGIARPVVSLFRAPQVVLPDDPYLS